MNQLSIAIIGHTNTGKTSLIRNLAKARNFGEVKDEPSTTIDVSGFWVHSPEFSFHYIDTPGIEDAMGILEILDEQFPIKSKVDEPKRLLAFTQSKAMHLHFEQEIKVIKQLFATDLAIYVIDVRLPYLPKFDHELSLILQAHKPILPIFNFLSQGDYLNDWKTHLKAHSIHAFLAYDTIVPPQKRRLFEQIAIMFPEEYEPIQTFITHEETHQAKQFNDAMQIVAEFYLNILTFQIHLPSNKTQAYIVNQLQQNITTIEQEAIKSLLKLYHFTADDVQHLALDVDQMRYDSHFFTTDNLINFSMSFGKGASVGAGLFASVDALAGFTTLGAATATGAILGGITNTLKHYGQKWWNDFNDIETYCINDEALSTLTSRMIIFTALLNGRSHAEIEPILLHNKTDQPNTYEHPAHHTADASPSLNKLALLIESTHTLRASPHYCQLMGHTVSKGRIKEVNKIKLFLVNEYSHLTQPKKL